MLAEDYVSKNQSEAILSYVGIFQSLADEFKDRRFVFFGIVMTYRRLKPRTKSFVIFGHWISVKPRTSAIVVGITLINRIALQLPIRIYSNIFFLLLAFLLMLRWILKPYAA